MGNEGGNEMKKFKIAIVTLLVLSGLFVFNGCNRDMVDTYYTYDYDYAYVFKPDGSIFVEGKVQQWRDYEDGEQIQVKIDGKTYLVSSYNCILVDT